VPCLLSQSKRSVGGRTFVFSIAASNAASSAACAGGSRKRGRLTPLSASLSAGGASADSKGSAAAKCRPAYGPAAKATAAMLRKPLRLCRVGEVSTPAHAAVRFIITYGDPGMASTFSRRSCRLLR